MKSKQDLTVGNINKKLWVFAIPLMLGNVMQQFYNLVDTWVVGKYIGDNALAAVGSSYSLMTFLTSVILGLCLGSSAFFSITFGEKNIKRLKNGMFISFVMIGIFSLILTFASFYLCGRIMKILQVPYDIQGIMSEYLKWIFVGIFATFLYNYFSNLLRGIGNSVIPLAFLCVSVILNIGLDLYFVLVLKQGISGAAIATVISQYISGIGLMIYVYIRYPELRLKHSNTVGNDVSATVCNEFRHTYGAGDCKQFRYTNYGGVCRFCENRHHCIYACTGFRKCVFDFYRTKFRCGQV